MRWGAKKQDTGSKISDRAYYKRLSVRFSRMLLAQYFVPAHTETVGCCSKSGDTL